VVTANFDWLLIGTAGLILLLAIGLVFHPAASKVLGADHEKPEFSRWSWFAMLFSAGLGPGLLYWGTAEPITHFGGNPFLPFFDADAGTAAASMPAIIVTIFHWGLHGWGMYVIAGLAIAIGAYRHDRPLTFSTALIPLLGEKRIAGTTGTAIDTIALFGTVFGVATSIGLSVGIINATMEPLTGLTFSLSNQIIFVIVVSSLGVFSVVSGVARGIRRISEINIWVSLALFLVFFLMGPTLLLLSSVIENLLVYIAAVLPMGFWLASDDTGTAWQAGWTVFYWGWWLAWTPFVALFVARISRGRTIREFILGVLLAPSLVVVVWMSVFGSTSIQQELAMTGSVSDAVAIDYSLAMAATIENMPQPELRTVLLLIVTFLLFTWLVTSLDSATLVICHILNFDLIPGMKVFWGFVLGGVTCTLMWIGGIQALQAASIIIGLPMALVMLLVVASLLKWVVTNHSKPTA
jgi:choline/glycine/proline betaine transport protein